MFDHELIDDVTEIGVDLVLRWDEWIERCERNGSVGEIEKKKKAIDARLVVEAGERGVTQCLDDVTTTVDARYQFGDGSADRCRQDARWIGST